ncbi:MAG: hypothetical protein ACTSO7_14230 [Candidatus Heimdallarchaeota archaeon]
MTINLDEHCLIITTAAVYEGLRKKYITQLSYPEKYVEDIFYQIANLKNSNVFDHIKDWNKKNKNLGKMDCLYLFTNLHKKDHQYEPIRLCSIKKIVMPEKLHNADDSEKSKFDDSDFVDFSIELGHFIGLHNENLRKDFQKYLDNYIKENNFHYQLRSEGKNNTYIFAVPKEKIKEFIDFKTNRGNKRWRDIVNRMLQVKKKPKNFYPDRPQEPVDFTDCFFYKWDIYDTKKDKLIEPKNGKYKLGGGKGYEIKFETYIPNYDRWKYTTRKSKVVFSDEGPIKPISDNVVIFSVSQISQQQHFSFSTKKAITKENGILHVKADSEKELVKEPDFDINFTVKRYASHVLAKSAILMGSLLTLIVAIVTEDIVDKYVLALLVLGSMLGLVSSLYEFIDSGLKK